MQVYDRTPIRISNAQSQSGETEVAYTSDHKMADGSSTSVPIQPSFPETDRMRSEQPVKEVKHDQTEICPLHYPSIQSINTTGQLKLSQVNTQDDRK